MFWQGSPPPIFATLLAQFARSLAQAYQYFYGSGVAKCFAIVGGGLAALQNLIRPPLLRESRLADWLFYAGATFSVLNILTAVWALIHLDASPYRGLILHIYHLAGEKALVSLITSSLRFWDYMQAIWEKFSCPTGTRVRQLKQMDIDPGYTTWFLDAMRISEINFVQFIKRLFTKAEESNDDDDR